MAKMANLLLKCARHEERSYEEQNDKYSSSILASSIRYGHGSHLHTPSALLSSPSAMLPPGNCSAVPFAALAAAAAAFSIGVAFARSALVAAATSSAPPPNATASA